MREVQSRSALRAASVTGSYPVDLPNSQACIVNDALNERDLILRDITQLRTRAAKEKQLCRRVDFNLQIQALHTQLSALTPSYSPAPPLF